MKDRWWKFPLWLALGTAFGIVLSKAQVLSVVRVRRMFALGDARWEPHMYLVIASAVAVGIVGVWLLKLWRKTDLGGEAFQLKDRPLRPGVLWGGLIFGVGWYITSACPGPIYVLLGSGAWHAGLIWAGALVGALIFSVLKPKLPA